MFHLHDFGNTNYISHNSGQSTLQDPLHMLIHCYAIEPKINLLAAVYFTALISYLPLLVRHHLQLHIHHELCAAIIVKGISATPINVI